MNKLKEGDILIATQGCKMSKGCLTKEERNQCALIIGNEYPVIGVISSGDIIVKTELFDKHYFDDSNILMDSNWQHYFKLKN